MIIENNLTRRDEGKIFNATYTDIRKAFFAKIWPLVYLTKNKIHIYIIYKEVILTSLSELSHFKNKQSVL